MKCGFGVDLGGTAIKIACFDMEGNIRNKWEIPTDTKNNGKQILPDIAASLLQYCKEHGLTDVLGVGIGVPGPVTGDGVVHKCVNLGWGEFNICQALEKLTGFMVKAGNDATVAAVGECWKGGGQGCKNMVMVTLGTGVGGGIVIDGKPLHGTTGGAGEIGHMVLNRNETRKCNCGKRGCVEQYCSATGIVRMATDYLAESAADSSLRHIEKITAKAVFDAAAGGDTVAQTVLEQAYAYLGEFLANLCCVIDPEVILLGGGVSKAGQPLLDGVRRYFDTNIFHTCENTKFALATLGNDAGVYGAFKLILG